MIGPRKSGGLEARRHGEGGGLEARRHGEGGGLEARRHGEGGGLEARHHGGRRGARRGFSLLEVMVALAILVTSMVIMMETQSASVEMTMEAEKLVTGTHLAQEKLAEARLSLEKDGFTDQDKCEEGDFSEFGDETMDLEFGDGLKKYRWAWCVSEIDLALGGDLAGMASSLQGSGLGGGNGAQIEGADAAAGLPGGMDLSAFGISNEMITETLGKYIREVRVHVWWGENLEESERLGDEIWLVSHAINPTGAIREMSTGQEGE